MDRRPLDPRYDVAYRHADTRARAPRSARCRSVLVVAVVYTVAVTVLATWRGPGISPDSVAYASAAQAFAETGTLTMFDGGYLRFFPPGLPLTLAGLSLLGLPLGLATTLLNCAAASGTVVITERIAARATGSPVLAAACAVTLAVSMGFVSVNAMLWTEPVVGFTTAVWILLLQRLHANAALTRADAMALALVITISYSYRYAAIFMVPVTALCVAAVYWRRGRMRAVARSALLAATASVGLAIIAVENARHGIEPLGRRAPSGLDGLDVGWQVLTGVGSLVVNTAAAPIPLLRTAGVAVVVALVILLARARGSWGWRRSGACLTSPLTPLVLATSAYWVFLAASELTTAINPIGYRLLYPILPAMVVLGAVGARALRARSRHRLVRRLWQIRFALLAAYVTVLACAGIGWSFDTADRGIRYNQVSLREDAWIPVVRDLPSDAGLISNNPYLVYWLTKRDPVHPAFGLAFYADADPDERARSLCSLVHEDSDTYLLWLGDDARRGWVTLRSWDSTRHGYRPVRTTSCSTSLVASDSRAETLPWPTLDRGHATMVDSSTSGGASAAARSWPVTSYGGHGFEEFVHAEFPRLWRLGRVLSGRDDDAWDLAQESLVKVGLHWSRIDRDGNPGAYARTCLVRLHIAGARRRRRETLIEPAHFERAAADGLETDAVEHADQVARLLTELPPRQRAAMTLYYLEDLSVRDIATILRCSEGTVKSQLARARAALQTKAGQRNAGQRNAGDPGVGSQAMGREDDQR